MTSSNPKPALLLVHGAWLTPGPYASLLSQPSLTDIFQVSAPRLPTTSDDVPPKYNLADDTELIRKELTSLANAGHPIVLLMHSYGGVVGSNACEGLGWEERKAQGERGGVVGLVYMAAFLLPVDTCLNTPFGNQLPPWLNEDKPNGTIYFKDVRQACFSDLEKHEQDEYISMLVACPTSVTFDNISYVPYGKIPATYIVFESDVELKKEVQEGMAFGVLGDPSGEKAKAGEGRWDVRLEYVDGGHCAFVKKPEEVAETLVRCWDRAREEYGPTLFS